MTSDDSIEIAYQKKLKKMTSDLTTFITDLNERIEKNHEFSSLAAIWKPISSAFVQLQSLLEENNRLAFILASRYLYEQSIQCLWMLKASNFGELERRHTMILKKAISGRIDYLNKKNELEPIKSETETPEFVKQFCTELTKNSERYRKEKEDNELSRESLEKNLRDKGLAPVGEAPTLDKMAEEALPCANEAHNRSLHFNIYKILSAASHPSVPFASNGQPGDFLKDYEGGTAVQVGKILAVKMIEYACDYTNEFIKNNS